MVYVPGFQFMFRTVHSLAAGLAVIRARLAGLGGVDHTASGRGDLALVAVGGGAGSRRDTDALPAALDDADAEVGADGGAVLADGAGADGHELAEVVVEGEHLGDLAGGQ